MSYHAYRIQATARWSTFNIHIITINIFSFKYFPHFKLGTVPRYFFSDIYFSDVYFLNI